MRESIESKPKTNGTSRDAISPDMTSAFHVKHQSLTGAKTMTRATTAAGSFNSSRHLLSDGSTVFNLRLWTHEGIWIDVAEMASEATAQQCSDMLTRVLHRFIACGSDREVLSLAVALEDTLNKAAKP